MIEMFIDLVPTGIMQSLIISFVAIGVMVPFRLLNFADLSSEGTFPLGGCFCAFLLIHQVNPITALLLSAILCGVMGFVTAMIHIKLKVNTLLAGIILSTILYSINLRFLGKPNQALFDQVTLFSLFTETTSGKIILLFCLNIVFISALYYFLITEKGLRFRAVGLNANVALHQGTDLTLYTLVGLFIGNALNGLGGALMVQVQGYADVGMGVGIVIHALAAIMIGETLIGNKRLYQQLLAPFVGALIYQQIQGFVMVLGLQPSDFKMVTGTIVLMTLAIQVYFLKKRE